MKPVTAKDFDFSGRTDEHTDGHTDGRTHGRTKKGAGDSGSYGSGVNNIYKDMSQ